MAMRRDKNVQLVNLNDVAKPQAAGNLRAGFAFAFDFVAQAGGFFVVLVSDGFIEL
ncbi:MAG TPA: hypothetical protein VKK61_03920 [Tepidisphaeraceae bacterium]|nr:hypothetical protein [Tepidisphaeraceae bacterium]